jgi:hypothetical protein
MQRIEAWKLADGRIFENEFEALEARTVNCLEDIEQLTPEAVTLILHNREAVFDAIQPLVFFERRNLAESRS